MRTPGRLLIAAAALWLAACSSPRLDDYASERPTFDLRRYFGIARPRILVTGLNPHAGESGHMGREEIDVIVPALARAKDAGIDARGPSVADAAILA